MTTTTRTGTTGYVRIPVSTAEKKKKMTEDRGTMNHLEMKPKTKWWKSPIVIAGGVLLIGVGIGSSFSKTQTVTVEKPVEKIVTKKVEVTPTACITALDLYEEVVTYSTQALGYSNEAMRSASRLDAEGIYAMNDKMEALTPKIKAATEPLLAAKTSCRASK